MSVLDLFGGMIGLYHVVPVNEAHVRVMFDKKELFCGREKDKRIKQSYWSVPFVTRVHRLPLTNIRIDVPDVKLNDKNMAKFSCDIVCFVNIKDPILAAERSDITITTDKYEERLAGIKNMSEDLRAIMESIGRTVATKQSILEIYMDRGTLDGAVTKEVEAVFPRWGLELVDLEIKDLKDTQGSSIITDIERKVAAEITADARVKVAGELKRAEIAEAENKKEAELVKAKNEEEWRKRQIVRDQAIGIADQQRELEIAKTMQNANAQKVEAEKKLTVGRAEITKQATITEAEGAASKIEQIGKANATIVKATKVAEAEGTQKLAEAMSKYDKSATGIELIRANKEIGMAQADAYKAGLANAKISIVSGQSADLVNGGLLGKISLGGKEGVAFQQFIQGLDEQSLAALGTMMASMQKK